MGSRRTTSRGRFLSRPLLVFGILVLFLLGLDFLGWLTGTKSFLFTRILGKRPSAPRPEEVAEIVRTGLVSQKIPPAIVHFWDSSGHLHLKIDLSNGQYSRLAPVLDRSLSDAGATVLGKQEEKDIRSAYYLWEVQGYKGQKTVILFSCRQEKPPTRKKPAPGPEVLSGRVALIVDDLGYSLERARAVCELNLPLAVSILPYSPYAVESAQIAHEHGLEILLHLPMESRNHHDTEPFTPGLIRTGMAEEEIREAVTNSVFQVPYIRGVNNHMGSLFTEDEARMEVVLSVLQGFGLYFIDSRTSPRSRAYDIARRLDLPAAYSDLFLDSATEPGEFGSNLRGLFRIARKRGWALGICHPYPDTLEALQSIRSLAAEFDVELVLASEIAHSLAGK